LLVAPIVTLSWNISDLLIVAHLREHTLKGRGPLNTRGEHKLGKVPKFRQESEDGGVGQDGVRIRLDAVVNNLLAFNPRRNEIGRNTDTSGVKLVGETFAVNSRASEGVVILILMLIVSVFLRMDIDINLPEGEQA
jgi:hypothetical protein